MKRENVTTDAAEFIRMDAAWCDKRSAAIGWIAYGEDGQVFGEVGERVRAGSALQAEAMGIRRVLEWAVSRNYLHVEVGTDCLQLLNQVVGVEATHHKISGLIGDLEVVFPLFHCLCFRFIPRSFNRQAHNLASRVMAS